MTRLQALAPLGVRGLRKLQRAAIECIIEKIVAGCVSEGRSNDLLAEVYLAGFSHGCSLADANPVRTPLGD